MIKYLVEAGCIKIQLGIEEVTEKVLKAYGKNTTLEEIFEVAKLCRDFGIQKKNFLTSVGDFSKIETEDLNRFEITKMQVELQNEKSLLLLRNVESR